MKESHATSLALPAPLSAYPTGVDRNIALASGALSVTLAVVALAGWLLGLEILSNFWPGGSLATPNTALGLAACGFSLILAIVAPRRRAAQTALSLAVVAFGVVFLLEYALNADFGVDDAIWRHPASTPPGRPSIPAAASFVAIGLSLALIPAKGTGAQFLRSVLAVLTLILATTGILGYVISLIDPSSHRVLIRFSVENAIAVLGLSVGVLAAGRRIALDEFMSLGAPIMSLVALAALVATSLVTIDSLHKVQTQAHWAENIETALSDLMDSLRDAEIGQRGYLLTGEQAYLQPYQIALPQVAERIDTIARLVRDNPAAQVRVAEIRALATEKMEVMRQTIEMKHAGDEAGALETVNSDRGKELMARLRKLIGSMENQEQARAEILRANADSQMIRLQFSTMLIVSSIIALAAFLFLDGRRRFEHLRRVQQELTFLNENLDRNVAEKTAELLAALETACRAEDNVRQLNAHLEEQVAARTRELDRIFRMSSDMLGIADFDGRLLRVSPACATVAGRSVEAAFADPALALVHPEDRAETRRILIRNLRGAKVVDFTNRCLHADGGIRWLSWRIVPVLKDRLFYFVARDVTEEHQREEILRQAQKMEAVGQLTGGIAHDFNNLLTVVIGNLDSLRRGLPDAGPRAQRQIDHALIGANKAAALISRLLAFSRRQPLSPENVEVNGLVAGMSEILRRTLGEQVVVENVLAGGLWRTEIDPNQLENAILNLAINARDAMPSGGRITIETANAHFDTSYVAVHPDAKVGEYVRISVNDTGHGMSPDVLARVFEPFFTTKPAGVGTGLGLSQVYGFIRQSGGHVAIDSEPGVGTTVKLYLPRSNSTQDRETQVGRPPSDDASTRGECVLVVEDEADVRRFVAETLEEAGYSVVAAANGPAALERLAAHPRIALLLSDVVLGRPLDGGQLRDEAVKLRPGLPVLFMTGYTRTAIIHNGVVDEGVSLLPKPFTASDLLRKVRQLLDEHENSQLNLF